MVIAAKAAYWLACIIAATYYRHHIGMPSMTWEWMVIWVAFYVTAWTAYDALRRWLPILATYRVRIEQRGKP